VIYVACLNVSQFSARVGSAIHLVDISRKYGQGRIE
jgi:hypothetical protein